MQEEIKTALRKAYLLGQTYWQQADSEYTSQHRKADETQVKFEQLVTDTIAALTSPAKVGGGERELFDKWLETRGITGGMLTASVHPFEAFKGGMQARAALSADGGEDKRDAEYWRFLREQHEGTESFEDAEGFTVTEPTARAFTVFKPGQGDYHLEPVGCMPGELEETIRAAIAANQAAEERK